MLDEKSLFEKCKETFEKEFCFILSLLFFFFRMAGEITISVHIKQEFVQFFFILNADDEGWGN